MAPLLRIVPLTILVTSLLLLPWTTVLSEPLIPGLIDPDVQPMFETDCPNAIDPDFMFDSSTGYIEVGVRQGETYTGLVDNDGSGPLSTPIWGYGQDDDVGYTWPGRTIEAYSYEPLQVKWLNELSPGYLLTGLNGESVVDTSIHWAYSLPGYEDYSIDSDGCPIVIHLHGGNNESPSDGNPEFFFSPGYDIKGPQWVTEVYTYHNTQQAASLWYHDHAIGITAPNVYTGLAGFYILRDELDTGKPDNPLKLPAYPYEAAFVVQDRMFKENGELFYPAFKGDPFYDDYITGENSTFPEDQPTKFAEFFGDVMTVNGKVWPKTSVEPRKYRLRYLNGCDSRYLILQFFALPPGATELEEGLEPLPFTIIGGDDGLASEPNTLETLLFEPSARYDIIFDFEGFEGYRIVLANLGGDEPFGGEATAQLFNRTDRVMAFDVDLKVDTSVADVFDDSVINFSDPLGETVRVRKLGLFEGRDEFNRLQPLLGTAEPATDMDGAPIMWPDTDVYREVGLAGKQMEGTMAWHSPTTENPKINEVEEWEIWNLSADGHPIHIHLVSFEVVSRHEIVLDSNAVENEIPDDMSPAGDGTYLEPQPLVQHDGSIGQGYRIVNPVEGGPVNRTGLFGYQENFPRDVVAALPGQVTRLKMKFNREGRFVWHCHILSHEDHEMMRVLHVGKMPEYKDHGGGDDASHEVGDDDHSGAVRDDDHSGALGDDDHSPQDDDTTADDYTPATDDYAPAGDDDYDDSGRRTFFFFGEDDDHYLYEDDDDTDDDRRTYFQFDGDGSSSSSSSSSSSDDRRNLREQL